LSDEHIPLDRGQSCSIYISGRGIDVNFTPALPEGKHDVTRTELMAAGALIGIARVLTGQGADEMLRSLVQFERQTAGKMRRR
jgi:hypothetical protein